MNQGKRAKKDKPPKGERKRGSVIPAILLLLAAFAVTAGCVLTGPLVLQGDFVTVGVPSPKKFKAPRQVINEEATNRLRDEAAAAVAPLYQADAEAEARINDKATVLFEVVSAARGGGAGGTAPDTPEGFSLTKAQMGQLTNLSSQQYALIRSAVRVALENTLAVGVKAETLEKSLQLINDEMAKRDMDTATYRLASAIAADVLEPNMLIDEAATENMRAERAAEVEPVLLFAGQTIVDDGEIVTQETYAILQSLGLVAGDLANKLTTALGLLAACVLLFLPPAVYVAFFRPQLAGNPKEALLLFVLYAVSVGVCRAMVGLQFYYFVPIALFAALAAALIDEMLSVVFMMFLTPVCALILGADLPFVLYFTINGAFAAITVRYVMNRNRMLTVAVCMSLLGAAGVAAQYFLFDKGYSPDMLEDMVLAVLSGLLTVLIAVGSMPVWETVFGVVTPYRLIYLTSPNNPVLKKLLTEAPGTYQHSVVVANLAENACLDVGANHTLARVGAYYHDIGKTLYPLYFSENQMGDNPHDDLSPIESVDVITGHVAYGLKLAKEYKLPPVLWDFIEQHHGTTLVKYFYYKAYEISLGEMPEPERYRYKHRKPQTRETAIVMLADTVEAAIRSMMPTIKSFGEIEETIYGMIKDKLEDGQLADSNLLIGDMDKIAAAFIRVFKGMNHSRVAYPKSPAPAAQADAAEPIEGLDAALGLAYEASDNPA